MADLHNGLIFPGNSAPRLFSVDERTALAVDAYDALGLVGDKRKASDQIGESMQMLHDRLASSSLPADVEPFFSMELSERFCLCALLQQFDYGQLHKSRIAKFWKQYSIDELNNRTLNDPPPTPLNPVMTGEARGMLLGSDHVFEKGLHLTNVPTERQKARLSGFLLMNPADYIMVNTQRRVAGLPPLDTNSVMRFIQLDRRREWGAVVDAAIRFEGANVGGERLNLHGIASGGYRNVGIRILAEQQV